MDTNAIYIQDKHQQIFSICVCVIIRNLQVSSIESESPVVDAADIW